MQRGTIFNSTVLERERERDRHGDEDVEMMITIDALHILSG